MIGAGWVGWFFRIFLAYARREWATAARYRLSFLFRLFGMVASAAGLLFMSRFIGSGPNVHLQQYGGNYLGFAIIGIVAADLQYAGLSALSQRVRMAQVMGHLEAELATPAPPWMVLGVVPLYEVGRAAARSIVYLAAAIAALGLTVDVKHPLVVLLAAGLTALSVGGLGLLSAGVTMLTRRGNPVAGTLAAASVLLSGIVFPTSVLPGWLQTGGALLPLTHALEALRLPLLRGAGLAEVALHLVWLLGFAVVLGSLGLALFGWALRRARDDGSLTHY
jgi:ABC-2 type transport system permease protein